MVLDSAIHFKNLQQCPELWKGLLQDSTNAHQILTVVVVLYSLTFSALNNLATTKQVHILWNYDMC